MCLVSLPSCVYNGFELYARSRTIHSSMCLSSTWIVASDHFCPDSNEISIDIAVKCVQLVCNWKSSIDAATNMRATRSHSFKSTTLLKQSIKQSRIQRHEAKQLNWNETTHFSPLAGWLTIIVKSHERIFESYLCARVHACVRLNLDDEEKTVQMECGACARARLYDFRLCIYICFISPIEMAQTKTQYIDLSIVNVEKKASCCFVFLVASLCQLTYGGGWGGFEYIYSHQTNQVIDANNRIELTCHYFQVRTEWWCIWCLVFLLFFSVGFRINLIILPIMHKWHNTQILPGLGHESSKKKNKNNKQQTSKIRT